MLLLGQRPLGTSDADRRLFVGREGELAKVARSLNLHLNVYVHGPPGIGRTSFLRQVQHERTEARYVNLGRFDSLQERLDVVVSALTGQSTVRHQGATPAQTIERSVASLSGVSFRAIEDPLQALRNATRGATRQSPRILLVDDLPRDDCQHLFGRLRDDMWELPILWVVTGTAPALASPANSFFEMQLGLSRFNLDAFRELTIRRVDTGTDEERHTLLRVARTMAASVTPCTPRQAVSVLRDVALSENYEELRARISELRETRERLSPTAIRVLDALAAHGPTHAGDETLLAHLEVTRSRVVQVLTELESKGLVSAERVGRRKIYSARRQLPSSTVPPARTAGGDDVVETIHPTRERTHQRSSSAESESRTVP